MNKMTNRLSLNLDYFMSARFGGREYTAVEAAKRCRDAGFTVVDYSPKLDGDDWYERIAGEAEEIRALGIDIAQTHAPFNRYTRFPEEVFHENLRRHFEAAKLMGVRHSVVHGNEYGNFRYGYDRKAAGDYVYDFLAPHIDFAVKNGIGIGIENLMEGRSFPEESTRKNYTTITEEVLELIDRFHDPLVTCCWDFGHAHVAYDNKMLDELKKVGSLLTCTHIHDNFNHNDQHLLPFMGTVDWKSHMRYLNQSGYQGEITFELVYDIVPAELTEDYLAAMYRIGERLLTLGAD